MEGFGLPTQREASIVQALRDRIGEPIVESRPFPWQALADIGAIAFGPAAAERSFSLGDATTVAMELGRHPWLGTYASTASWVAALAPHPAAAPLLARVAAGQTELGTLADHGPRDEAARRSGSAVEGLLVPGGTQDVQVIHLAGHRLMAVPLAALDPRATQDTARSRTLFVGPGQVVPEAAEILVQGPAATATAAIAGVVRDILSCFELVGALRELLEMARSYSLERVQFGHAIGAYQGVAHALVDLLADIEAAWLAALSALRGALEANPTRSRDVAIAVLLTRNAAWSGLMVAHDVHGGIGFMEAHPLSRYTRAILPRLAALDPTAVLVSEIADGVVSGHWLDG